MIPLHCSWEKLLEILLTYDIELAAFNTEHAQLVNTSSSSSVFQRPAAGRRQSTRLTGW